MTKSLVGMPVADLVALYRKGKVSPVDSAKAALAQVALHNPTLNAICHMDEKETLRLARASEKRWMKKEPLGPLDGVTVTVKDWYDIKGWPTRMGSSITPADVQKQDSPCVARLRAAGAVFVGKTTLPEFGHKGVTDSPLTGITRNPWNTDKTPGGSSGGAAAAAAAGMASVHIGSDAGGSVRIPASFTGVAGFKPSPGVVPSWPPSLFSTLSSIGTLTLSVRDAAYLLDVVTQPDARDWHALPITPPRFVDAVKRIDKSPPRKLKIAYAPTINGIGMTSDVAPVMKDAVKKLSALGRVHEIALDVPDLVDVFNSHWMAVAAYIAKDIPAHVQKKMDPRFLHWAKRGSKMHLNDYLKAERNRMAIGEYFKKILTEYDVLITPTTAMPAFDVGVVMPRDAKGDLWDDWTPFTYPANLAKLPAVSIPAGLTKFGLPVGCQIMAGYLNDAALLQVAAVAEDIIGFNTRRHI